MKSKIKSLFLSYATLSDVAKATFWFFLCNILNKCIAMLTNPIFTRILSTEQFGIYQTFLSWNFILTILVTLRLDYGVFNKGISKYPNQREDYTATMQSITSFLTIVVFLFYLLFHQEINLVTGLSTNLSILLFVEIFFYNAVPFWMLQQRYDFKYKSVVSVSLSFSILHMVLGVIGVLLTHNQAIGRIYAILLVNIIMGMYIYIYNFKKATKLFRMDFAKFALTFNFPLLPHYFSSYIIEQFDRIMIQKLINYSAVGIYSVAHSCGYVIKIISSSLSTTLIPWMYRKLEEENYTSIRDCINSITHCVILCFMGYMVFAPEIIWIFAPEKYHGAIYALPPITTSVFLIFVYEIYANIELYYDKNKFATVVSLTGAVINVILNYLFIPKYGYVMAAYTTLVSYIYFSIMHYIYLQRVTREKTNKTIFSPVDLFPRSLILIVYCLLVNFTYQNHVIRFALIACLLLYVVLRRKQIFRFIRILK